MPYRLFHHIPLTHFYELPEEIKHFYELSIIRAAFLSVGALFLPLYIYTTLGLGYTLFYLFLSYGLFRLISRPLNVIILREWGIETAMFLAILMSGLMYLLVFLFGINEYSILLFSILEAFSFSLYWDAYHLSFSVFGRERQFGSEVADLTFIENFISILSPIAASAFIYYLGFHTFYGIVFVFTLILSLFLVRGFKKTYKVPITFEEVINAPFRRLFFVEGILSGLTTPGFLLLYLVLQGSVLAFGAVKTVIGLFVAFFSHLLGYYFDRKLPFWMGKLMYLGSTIYALIVSFTLHPLWVSLGEIIRWVMNTFQVAVSATLYTLARKTVKIIALSRSFYITMGRMLTLFLVLIAYYMVSAEDIVFIQSVIMFAIPVSISMVLLYSDIERALR